MKFVISLCFSVNAFAVPIQVLYEEEPTRARWVKAILAEEYHIPEELIGMKQVQECERVKKRKKLELCLKNNGDLYVVSVDRIFISESLKIFQAP